MIDFPLPELEFRSPRLLRFWLPLVVAMIIRTRGAENAFNRLVLECPDHVLARPPEAVG